MTLCASDPSSVPTADDADSNKAEYCDAAIEVAAAYCDDAASKAL